MEEISEPRKFLDHIASSLWHGYFLLLLELQWKHFPMQFAEGKGIKELKDSNRAGMDK